MHVKYSERAESREPRSRSLDSNKSAHFFRLLFCCVLVGHTTKAVLKPGEDVYVSSTQSGGRATPPQLGEKVSKHIRYVPSLEYLKYYEYASLLVTPRVLIFGIRCAHARPRSPAREEASGESSARPCSRVSADDPVVYADI